MIIRHNKMSFCNYLSSKSFIFKKKTKRQDFNGICRYVNSIMNLYFPGATDSNPLTRLFKNLKID